MFMGYNCPENYMCPNLAPLFLNFFDMYKYRMIASLVTHVLFSVDLTVKLVIFHYSITG